MGGADEGHMATEFDGAFVALLKSCHELVAAQVRARALLRGRGREGPSRLADASLRARALLRRGGVAPRRLSDASLSLDESTSPHIPSRFGRTR